MSDYQKNWEHLRRIIEDTDILSHNNSLKILQLMVEIEKRNKTKII